MSEQIALCFARERTSSQSEIADLEAALAGAGWRTAAELGQRLSWPDRKVRAVAASDARFISWPGSPGYKLLEECTREEFAHFERATLAQADEMRSRVIRAQREWYRRART